MLEKLLAPGKIGKMQLRNHVLMSPTETHFTSPDGMINWAEIDYPICGWIKGSILGFDY